MLLSSNCRMNSSNSEQLFLQRLRDMLAVRAKDSHTCSLRNLKKPRQLLRARTSHNSMERRSKCWCTRRENRESQNSTTSLSRVFLLAQMMPLWSICSRSLVKSSLQLSRETKKTSWPMLRLCASRIQLLQNKLLMPWTRNLFLMDHSS